MRNPLLALVLCCAAPAAFSASRVEVLPDGLLLDLGSHRERVTVCADNIVRVTDSLEYDGSVRPSLAAVPLDRRVPAWTWRADEAAGVLATRALKLRIDFASGRIVFFDLSGRPILAEKEAVQKLTPAVVQGEHTFHVRQEWETQPDEALFGLGQHQFGWVNIKGHDLDLWQHNTSIAIPYLVSSRGYGILWDNPSYTRWGDLQPWTDLAPTQMLDRDGNPGALTASYSAGEDFGPAVSVRRQSVIDISLGENHGENQALDPKLPRGAASVRWEGDLAPSKSGDYQFLANYDGELKLWIDGRLLMNHWRQNWLAAEDRVTVPLGAGQRHHIRIDWRRDDTSTTCQFRWKPPGDDHANSLWSEVGDGVDYYFVYGPGLDHVVAGYRQITGQAAMMPQWAFGLWQSRERYQTAQESLAVVDEFRRRRIPFDNIVQDWQYWRKDQWGSHEFDPARFPDPAGWVKAIHDRHAHVMISVWGKFYRGTEHFAEMERDGFLYPMNLQEHALDWLGYPFAFVDAFNPAARRLFWDQMKTTLLPTGVDAWWMDASEPDLTARPELENQKRHVNPNYLGTGARFLLGYPVQIARAVYEGQREAKPDQRVFNLTRSGYLGLQRYGAASWSGDTTSTWTAMRKQIAAGLGYSISGLPYWTMDIGGFSVPDRFEPERATPESTAEWREMNTRWFQFGTFVPLLRAHGQTPYREMWQFGEPGTPAFDAMLSFDRLRYRLLPYIYSLAGGVTQDGGVLLRPLVMDFPGDTTARDLSDQYLFGPAFLVSPVTEYRQRSRSVYLPATAGGWYDLFTGENAGSGRTADAPAPFAHIPVFVRAGSIVPLGPDQQYTGEKPADPLTVVVYTGADGHFQLYEDDGLTYRYEQGAFARIPLSWNESARSLTIGGREGSFPGMLAHRTIHVVLVAPGKARSLGESFSPDATIAYDGSPVTWFAE